MKKILLVLLMGFIAFTSKAQYMDRFHSPSNDPIHIYYNAPSLSGINTEFIIFPDTIPSGTMYSGKTSYFSGFYKISSGVSLSNLTIKIKYGTGSLTILNAASLGLGLSSKIIRVEVWMDGELSVNHQIICAQITNEDGIVLSKANYQITGDFTQDPNNDLKYHITMQLGGIGYTGITITPQQQIWKSN